MQKYIKAAKRLLSLDEDAAEYSSAQAEVLAAYKQLTAMQKELIDLNQYYDVREAIL